MLSTLETYLNLCNTPRRRDYTTAALDQFPYKRQHTYLQLGLAISGGKKVVHTRMYCSIAFCLSQTHINSHKKMDSTYAGHGFGETYSQFSRLRTGSGVSTTEDFLPNLHVADSSSFDIGSYPSTRSQSSQGQPSPAYFSPTLSQSPSFLSTPVSQQQQPFSLLPSEGATNSEWFGAKCQSRETPLLQVESATAQSRVTRSSSPLASTETETMR